MFPADAYGNVLTSALISRPELYIEKDKMGIGTEERLAVWLHCRNVTYRAALRVREVCPEAATVFECTQSAQVCIYACSEYPLECLQAAEHAGTGEIESVMTYFNSEEFRCDIVNTGSKSDSKNSNTISYILVPVIIVCAGLLLIAAYLLVSFPPGQKESRFNFMGGHQVFAWHTCVPFQCGECGQPAHILQRWPNIGTLSHAISHHSGMVCFVDVLRSQDTLASLEYSTGGLPGKVKRQRL